MGFHKRWINEEQLIERYRETGIQGIEDYFGKADAFVMEDDLSEKVIELLDSDKLTSIERWNEISMLVSMASIKKWKDEKKTTVTPS
tara:strand:+ start:90 stop:350 length:261 start_codon:yes stop_codon:yes gene_type:complete